MSVQKQRNIFISIMNAQKRKAKAILQEKSTPKIKIEMEVILSEKKETTTARQEKELEL